MVHVKLVVFTSVDTHYFTNVVICCLWRHFKNSEIQSEKFM